MNRSTRPRPTPVGTAPVHAVQVLSGCGANSPAHVRSLADGLVERGLRVTVCAPPGTEPRYGFTATGAHFVPAPVRTRAAAVAALRRVCAEADLVHAHGLRAGLLAALALGAGAGGGARPPLVLTWHARGQALGLRAQALRLLERHVVRESAVVLATTTDLLDRARARGARDARLAPVVPPGPRATRPPDDAAPDEPGEEPQADEAERLRLKARAELGAVERPLILSVGRLSRNQGYDTVLTAARSWRHLDPPPLLVVAGEGPDRAALQRRIDEEELPVRLLGRRADALALLPLADVALLSARWEGRALLAREALRAGVPLVSTAVGGVPELVGDAAELVPYGDADALAEAVTRLAADPERCAELAERGLRRAARWREESDTLAQVLSVYDELTTG
ncbi:glycosyltransferase family 4 protein [Streptomyces sp. HNM0574]|uniref:glycosyltransferase family 4 protein n=1 Tax=Streptomyces sp. HNM0574 TaxID=2714954 RepID=UPI0032163CB0